MNRSPVYLIFGAGGLLGNALLTQLSNASIDQHRVFSFDHEKADITDPNQITPLLEYVRPTVVVNCAAVNDEDICEDAKTGAFNVNSRGPQYIAEACKKFDAKFVHYSSSTVFDGSRCTPYNERHATKPISVHGQSKVSGEQAIREAYENHIIIRPGWVFHCNYGNCVTQWMSIGDKGEDVPVLDDSHGSPTFASDLADATINLLNCDVKGTFHFANSDAATRQSFAEATLELSKIKAQVVTVSRESQKYWKAPSPPYSVLSCRKYAQVTGETPRSWLDALKHCLFSMNRYKP